jgi:hypothetical protein
VLEGLVLPKESALTEYNDAKASYKTAALLEEHTPEIFEIRLGNLPAASNIKIEIGFIHELKIDPTGSGILVTVPTTLAPRYGPKPADFSVVQSLEEDGLEIVVNATLDSPIRQMESRTHPISVEVGIGSGTLHTTTDAFDPKKSRATLVERNPVLRNDFVVMIIPSNSATSSQALMEIDTEDPNFAALMVTVYPRQLFPLVTFKNNRDEFIFVADRSSSMQDKMEPMKQALLVFLRSLP